MREKDHVKNYGIFESDVQSLKYCCAQCTYVKLHVVSIHMDCEHLVYAQLAPNIFWSGTLYLNLVPSTFTWYALPQSLVPSTFRSKNRWYPLPIVKNIGSV